MDNSVQSNKNLKTKIEIGNEVNKWESVFINKKGK